MRGNPVEGGGNLFFRNLTLVEGGWKKNKQENRRTEEQENKKTGEHNNRRTEEQEFRIVKKKESRRLIEV